MQQRISLGASRIGSGGGLAGGGTITGDLIMDGNLTMQAGRKLFIDDGDSTDPGLAFRLATTYGLARVATTMRIIGAATTNLTIAGSTVGVQVPLVMAHYHALLGNTGITASTTQSQGQGALTVGRNFHTVDTVANANDVVTMPSAVLGQYVIIGNRGANTLQIFPASGDNFQGTAVNASITLAAGGEGIYLPIDTTTWLRVLN